MGLSRGRFRSVAALILLATVALVAPGVTSADDSVPGKRALTPQELLRKRIAESLAGRRDMSAPHSQTLNGPELSDREKLLHVMNRMSFGFTPGEVEEAVKMGGWQAWAKFQMDPSKIDDATCDRKIAERFPWTKENIQQLESHYGYRKGKEMRGSDSLYNQLPQAVLTRAVLSKREFKEVMCDFWRNHFCIDQPEAYEKTRSWTAADYEEQVIRKNVFGKFSDMLEASAHHPAMLEYLDNKLSRVNEWNENYARELMELHTLGADKGYGNKDVSELSKILTGWNYDENYKFTFNAKDHQPGPKVWLGAQVPEGYRGGEMVLQTLANHPNTAQFISEKLCRYLVNDNPPPTLVRHVATVFRTSHGDLPKVYWEILSSKEFMNRENYRAKFKTPFQFAVSALRSTAANLENTDSVCKVLTRMGEPIYNCPDPTGYRDQAESWMDAGVLTSRWQFAWDLMRGSVYGVTIGNSFVDRYRSLKPEEAEEKMIEELDGGEVGDRELASMKDAAAKSDLARMIAIILGAPSFQQR